MVPEAETAATMDTAVDDKHVEFMSRAHEPDATPEEFRFYGQDIPIEQTKFWKRPLLILQYAIILSSIVSRQLWILQGILGVWGLAIATVVYAWICYIIRDPQLLAAISSMRWYFGFAVRQAEATVQGGTGRRMVEGGVLAWRGTATSFLKWFLRQRSENVNRQMVQQHETNMERFKKLGKSGKKI